MFFVHMCEQDICIVFFQQLTLESQLFFDDKDGVAEGERTAL